MAADPPNDRKLHGSISTWLDDIGLGQFASVFAGQQIELEDLPELSEHDLEKLGIPLGPRKRLLKAIRSPSPLAAGKAASPASPSPPTATGGEGECRQLTVLFCDMVGFTELANRVDPEVLQRIIRAYEDTCAACITRYEGFMKNSIIEA